MTNFSRIKEIYDTYQALSQKYLPEANYIKMVSEEKQEHEIDVLKNALHYERFFFVINLHECRIERAHGIEQWLGYPDKDFTMMKFLQIIHPSQLEAHQLTATELITGLMKGEWKIEFMKHRYTSRIALQHSKGHYLVYKRLGNVFQYNEKHQLLEYINDFTYIEQYNEHSYKIGSHDQIGETLNWWPGILERMKQAFQKKESFSPQELRILHKFAHQPGITVADIAKSFKVKTSTITTHKKRLLKKAENIYEMHFIDIQMLAQHLKDEGLI